MVGGLGLTEATGVTNLRGTVIRIFTPDGTLVVEVGDPSVKVTIEGDGGLVITGAGPQEVRLRPGSYRVQAARDGKRVPLERELVSIAKGGREVVKVKLEGPLAPAAAKAEKGAFVLLVGGKERKFDTLAEAVAAAQSGDTIEIRGNGPFVSHPIKVQGQALVIRAADGFRPVLHLSPEGIETYASLLETNAPLVLEGLEFHLVGGKVPSPSGPPEIARTVRSRDAVLHVANCRFLVKGEGVGVSAVGSPICELRNCELLSSGMLWWRLGCKPPRGGQILVHNSLLVGGDHGLAIWYEYPDLHDITIRLADNTFAPRKALSLILSRTPDPISADRKKSRKPFRVEALANVFDEQDAFLQIEQPSELLAQAKAFQPAEIEALVPRLFDWYERHNHYPAAGELLGLSVRAQLLQPTRPISVLPQWKQFWGLTKIDAQQGRVRYQTSDVLSRIVVADKEITPRDFRLAAGSPGKGARPGGRDPGIDPDLVGPGLAYERWKKMPAYQQWRQDTGQVKKAKGPKAEKPFVVTGGQAVAERKFNSLAEAAAAASGGGTIEIRGNGPFISLPLQLGGKALTIRAAAGYCPVLQLREPTDPTRPLFSTSARLVLEGLEIRSLARPSGAEAFSAATVVISRDAPLRIANCRLLLGMEGEGTNLAFNAYKVPDLELRNCQFILGPHCSLGYWHCPTGGRLTAEGNVMAASLLGRLTILVNNMKSKNVPTNVALRWTRNTVLMGDLLSFELSHIPELAGGGGKQPVTPCRLEASENLFDTTQAILTLSQNQPGESEVKPLPAAQADALVRYLVTWQDQCNGFPEGVNLLGFDFDGEPLPTAPQRKTLADWQAFWGLKDTRSVQGRARYQGGDLRARLASAPEQLTAGDFRLHPNSTGRGAGVGGRDLGADVDLVGPGTAYERWKKTPAYQQWRKDTGQEKK